jgi:hypothetical protein
MEVVEDYINKYTRNYSNEILVNGDESYTNIPSKGEYHPWLTPDHARSVAEIAREETIKEVCGWLYNHNDYICGSTNGITMYDMDKLIEDLKKHFNVKL